MSFHVILDQQPELKANVAFDRSVVTTDDGLAFMLSQLSYVESKIYETKYRNIIYDQFVPVETDVPEWADEFTYFSYDAVTMGKFIGANAKDIPNVALTKAKHSAPLFAGGIGYTYSLDELRKSQAMNLPLDVTEAKMALRGFQEHAQKVAFFGDEEMGVTGLFNNANISKTTSAADFMTDAKVAMKGIQTLVKDIWINSAQVHLPDLVLIPGELYGLLGETRMDTGTDTTVLAFLQQNNIFTQMTGQALTIKPILELKTAGTSGKAMIMAYELNNENLTMKMSIPLRFLPPQADGLAFDVNGEYKFGGVEVRYPGAFGYLINA